MTDTKHAFAEQSFSLANDETSYLPGAVIQDMAANQFADLEAIGLVREATDAEVAAANQPAPSAPALTETAGD